MPRETIEDERRKPRPRAIVHEAPRDVKEGSKQKEFFVSEGCSFFDEDGKKRRAGEKVKLSQKMAQYLADRGMIRVKLDFDNEEDDADPDNRTEGGRSRATSAGNSSNDLNDNSGSDERTEGGRSEITSAGNSSNPSGGSDGNDGETTGDTAQDSAGNTDNSDGSDNASGSKQASGSKAKGEDDSKSKRSRNL